MNPLGHVRSFTFRLTLFYLLLFSASIGLLIGFAYWTSVLTPLKAVQRSVGAEAAALAPLYAREGAAAFARRLQARASEPSARKAYHALIAPDGRAIEANLPAWPTPRAAPDWLRFEFESYGDGAEVEHEAVARDITFPDGVRLVLGRDTEDLDEREDFITESMAWGVAFTVVLGFAGGLLMSRAVGLRLESVLSTARQVIAGDLSGRVAVQGSGDDFDALAETLNAMLARIEALIGSVGRVSDSIAHELRTPLARLHADLEDLAAGPINDPRTRQLAERAIAEAERLQSTFDALLRIARIETGRHVPDLAGVDLAALARDAVELYQPVAEQKGQALVLRAGPAVETAGDANLLFQAVSNLLDNAIKYGSPGGVVIVEAVRRDGDAVILVSDDGPGAPSEHLPRLTERFYRAPRTEAAHGLGLGLALVAAVARSHGATLTLRNTAPGFAAELRLPATA